VSEGKPHPAPYLAGAALLGLRRRSAWCLKTRLREPKRARAAGCTVVATTFSHSIESLAAAHYLIEDLTGVEVASGFATLARRRGIGASVHAAGR
jgi:sugar-phosphatase